MLGSSYLLVVVLGLTALMGLSLAVGSWILKRALRRLHARRRVLCPHLRQFVDCTLSWDAKTSRWCAIDRCAVFTAPGEVHCNQTCLRLLNQQTNQRLAAASRPQTNAEGALKE